jgi:hypothetical protein
MKRLLPLLFLAALGCRRDHIRTYDIEPQVLILIQDQYQTVRTIEIGDDYLVTSDREALIVIENARQTRYPLVKGWTVSRDDDSFTIEEIPRFQPY